MRCDACTRKLGRSELVHSIQYGNVDNYTNTFVPAADSAATIICQTCGAKLLKLIYSKLGNPYTQNQHRY